jgi:hypothetical protein
MGIPRAEQILNLHHEPSHLEFASKRALHTSIRSAKHYNGGYVLAFLPQCVVEKLERNTPLKRWETLRAGDSILPCNLFRSLGFARMVKNKTQNES